MKMWIGVQSALVIAPFAGMYSNGNSVDTDIDLGKKGQRFFSMVYDALSIAALNFRHFRMDSDVS